MPKLSLIEFEAARLVGRVPEARRRVLQQALIELCDAHWLEIRNQEPATSLTHALWSATPSRADLLADLVAAGDGRLDDVLSGAPIIEETPAAAYPATELAAGSDRGGDRSTQGQCGPAGGRGQHA